ncbi:MAG: RES family NAD+ phosphorylase [Kaistella sp.]
MIVFNIRKSKYAFSLKSSGVANRWNKNEEFVIYTAEAISLATLELVAHKNAIEITSAYKLLFIHLDISEHNITELKEEALPKNWKSIESYPALQNLGSQWYQEKKSLILKVPSALIHWEHNYIINVNHPDFNKKVSIISTEDFSWDHRLI